MILRPQLLPTSAVDAVYAIHECLCFDAQSGVNCTHKNEKWISVIAVSKNSFLLKCYKDKGHDFFPVLIFSGSAKCHVFHCMPFTF